MQLRYGRKFTSSSYKCTYVLESVFNNLNVMPVYLFRSFRDFIFQSSVVLPNKLNLYISIFYQIQEVFGHNFFCQTIFFSLKNVIPLIWILIKKKKKNNSCFLFFRLYNFHCSIFNLCPRSYSSSSCYGASEFSNFKYFIFILYSFHLVLICTSFFSDSYFSFFSYLNVHFPLGA